MVDLDILEKYGVTAEKLKDKFSPIREKRSEKINKLIDLMKNRCQAGRDMNFEKYPIFQALDAAWDAAFNQVTPTLAATLCDRSADDASVMDTLKAYNINPADVVMEVPDPKTPNKNIKKISVPAFFRVTVPLCAAYLKIRWAKIVNDRRLVPFLKYEPVISDEISRMRCEVITARVESISRQYGYFDVMKQAVFRMLHYGECLQFPVEEWHREYQEVAQDAPQKEVPKDELDEGMEAKYGKIIVTKEGIRYHLPHPSRTYYDRTFHASTFNTDSGCTYAGYWRVLTYKHLLEQKDKYFNIDKVGFGDFYQWFSGKKTHTYWTNVLRGCAINFPGAESDKGISKLDTETNVAMHYSAERPDTPIVVHEHFEKLVPKDWELGDYPHPVWFRFSLAADDTVIYVAPVAYNPLIWYGYDYAEGRTHTVSMTLECLPFQDQFSNLLSQHLLTIRQNLSNATLMDTDVIPEDEIKKIENWGEKFWRSINIVRISFKKVFQKQGTGIPTNGNPTVHIKFPYQDANAILQAMRTILDTLERVLVMSAQEVGQSASHEQTREEVRHISMNTATRVVFTATAVDTGRDTWKRQIYDALMAYGSAGFYAQVPLEKPIEKAELEKLGFTTASAYDKQKKRIILEGDNTALAYESFASDRDGEDRVNDVETGKMLIQLLAQVSASQILMETVGPEQMIMWLNYAARFLGMPRDFKLVNNQDGQWQGQMQQMIQQLGEQMQQGLEGLKQDTAGALEQIGTKNLEQDKVLGQLIELVGMETPQRPNPEDLDNLDTTIEPATPEDIRMATVG